MEKSRELIRVMEDIGRKYNASPAQVALNWVIYAHGDLVVTIPGVTNPRQASAIALSEARKRGLKVPKRKKG